MPDKVDIGGNYFVTGGSAGIGAAVVKNLVKLGCQITSVSRRKAAIKSACVDSIQCDLSDLDQIGMSLKGPIRNRHFNGAILCHGFGDFGCLEQFSDARIRRLVDTNLTSNILLARMLIPPMKTAGGGTLVLIGSEAALKGGKQGAVYAATKFALRGLAQSLRQECSGSGVRISLVNPGMVDTGFFDKLSFTPGESKDNVLSAEDVATAVIGILEAPPHAVIDEVNLSPLKTVVRHR
ncbi:MAG: SDR family oxidoreductase [bacterium]